MAKYGFRDIVDVSLFEIADESLVTSMDYLKTASQTYGSEIVYQMGGRGAPKLVGFQSENSMRMELTSALFTPKLLSIIFGTDLSAGVKYVPVTEKVTVTTNSIVLTNTPYTGDLNTYPINVAPSSDLTTPDDILEKVVGTPEEGEYSLSTKTITLNDYEFASGGSFIVTFYKASSSSTQLVTFDTDKFVKAYKLTGYTTWKNTEDERTYPCYIVVPKLQLEIDGAALNAVMNGDPSDLVLNGEALQLSSSEKSLIKYYIDEGAPIN
jgi:hypothetical protein